MAAEEPSVSLRVSTNTHHKRVAGLLLRSGWDCMKWRLGWLSLLPLESGGGFVQKLACLFGPRPVDRLEFFTLKRVVGFKKRLDFVKQVGAKPVESFDMGVRMCV